MRDVTAPSSDGDAPQGVTVSVEGLSCRRGDRLLFRDLSFGLAPGDALVVTGPNGVGKSSLLRVLAGLLAPEAGRVLIDGAASDDLGLAAISHLIGHLDAVKPALTVLENLRFGAGILGDPGGSGARAPAHARALRAFALDPLAARPARFLSAGQKRRLALARLLAAPRPIWLLDEPSVGLDQDNLARLLAVIADHRARGGAVLITTHQPLDLDGAATLALRAR